LSSIDKTYRLNYLEKRKTTDKKDKMQTIVIAGFLIYSLTYLITGYFFRNYVSREIDPEPARAFDLLNRRYHVYGINLAVALIAMVIIYFAYSS
jgi:H+/gluconate symporter-like permease